MEVWRLLKSRENIVFYLLTILASLSYLVPGSSDPDVGSRILLSNFTTYCSNLLLLILFTWKVSKNIRIKNQIIVRVGWGKFYLYQLLTTELMVLIYIVVQYSVDFSSGGISPYVEKSVIIFSLALNALIFVVMGLVTNLTHFKIKLSYTLLFNTLLLFGCHYGFFIPYLTSFDY